MNPVRSELPTSLFRRVFQSPHPHVLWEKYGLLAHPLRAAAGGVERYLAGLRLRLNPAKTHLVPAHRGVAFLGFHVYRSHRTLLVEGKVRARKRLRRLAAAYEAGDIGPAEVRASVRAWIAHAEWGDTWRLRARMLREVAFRRLPAAQPAQAGEVAMA